VISDKLLQVYFETSYPQAPILDVAEFMDSYASGSCSIFLLQAILAVAMSRAPRDLATEAGYEDNLSAAKALWNRAQLIYDFGLEKSPLIVLQGCILLHIAYAVVKQSRDYRFWLATAMRVATHIGLHKRQTLENIDTPVRKLFRRIWAFLYYEDIFVTCAGFKTVRSIHDDECDIVDITEMDWSSQWEGDPPRYYPEGTRLQRLYFIHTVKLSKIGQ
jgi:hypothetical protein